MEDEGRAGRIGVAFAEPHRDAGQHPVERSTLRALHTVSVRELRKGRETGDLDRVAGCDPNHGEPAGTVHAPPPGEVLATHRDRGGDRQQLRKRDVRLEVEIGPGTMDREPPAQSFSRGFVERHPPSREHDPL